MNMKCCICGIELDGHGNNPDGAAWKNEQGEVVTPEFDITDRCCDGCNIRYVLPGRLYRMNKNK